jgi:hypothetical protein
LEFPCIPICKHKRAVSSESRVVGYWAVYMHVIITAMGTARNRLIFVDLPSFFEVKIKTALVSGPEDENIFLLSH